MYKRRSKSNISTRLDSDVSSSVKANTSAINKENKSDVGNLERQTENEEILSGVMFEEEIPTVKAKDSNKLKSKKGLSFLEEITRFSGMIIHKRDSPNQLEIDQAVFAQKVSTFLSRNEGNVKRNVIILMDDLKSYCRVLYRLKNALSHTVTVDDCEVTRGKYQDSLMRLFLQVDALFQPISQFLVDKMAEITADDQISDHISWVRLIVQALKYLDNPLSECKLGEKLLDIMLVSSDIQIQQEIITNLPAIISEDEHSSCATELSKLVTNETLLGVAIDALGQLIFDSDIQLEVQETLIHSLRRVSADYLPVVVKFLLSTCTAEHVNEVLNGLRTDLTLKDPDPSTQVLVFKSIQDCLLAVKFLSPSWLKNISSIKSSEFFRPLDFIVCLIIYTVSTDETKKRSIVTLLRNKIKDKVIKNKLLTNTFSSFLQVILQYFQSLMRLASVLLKSPDLRVVDIAGFMYSCLFKHVDDYYCKFIVNELLVCIGSTGTSSALSSSAFKILNKLALEHPTKIKRLSQLLIVLLNKLNELNLTEARQFMDMLCNVAYCSDSSEFYSSDSEVLKDELNMFVQKQFSSLQMSIVSVGVVGIVMLIKHIATIPKDSSISNEHIDGSVEDVTLTPYAKKALPLFELLLCNLGRNDCASTSSGIVNCRDSADILKLAVDQLSYMMTTCYNFDQTLNHHMATVLKKKLKEMYLVSYSQSTQFSNNDSSFPMNVIFCLNEGLKTNDAVNVGPLACSEAECLRKHVSNGLWPLSCMNPTLRFLAALERHDMSEIDVLLGCGIVFPSLEVFSPSSFKELSPFEQHIALNCLFYMINWFFEIINCFSFMIKLKQPKKVLMRLRLVVWLMDLLAHCLPLTMEYTPPLCSYSTTVVKRPVERKTVEKGKRKRKTGKSKGSKKKTKFNKTSKINAEEDNESDREEKEEDDENDREEDESENDDEKSDCTEKETEQKSDLSLYSNYFRELDINVWLFLTQSLTFMPTPVQDGNVTPEMGPSELLFILDDFVKKVEHKLPSSVKKLTFMKFNSASESVGFESIDALEEEIIVKNTVNLLGNLCVYLDKTFDYTRELIRENDEIYDSSGLFLPGTKEVKQCQNRILTIMSILFAWHGFKDNSNSKLLNDGLQKMASKLAMKKYKTPNKTTMIRDICNSLADSAPKILDIKTAFAIVTLMKTLAEHADDNDSSVKPLISKMCSKFLSRPWFDFNGAKEVGSAFYKQIHMILLKYINCAENQLDLLAELTSSVENEVNDLPAEKDACLQMFPVFNRTNINWLIDGILKGLEDSIKSKIMSKVGSDTERFKMWSKALSFLTSIDNIVKKNDNRVVLRVYVKGMVNILKLIKNHALSIFSLVFKECHNEVSVVLKTLQKTTRYLQAVCTYTKVTRDGALQHNLPTARSLMESLAFDIRHIFIQSNCTQAWFFGNMKHRNLKGEEIPTQVIDDDNDAREDESDNENERSEILKDHSEDDDDDDDGDRDGKVARDGMDVDDDNESQESSRSDDSSDNNNSVSDLC